MIKKDVVVLALLVVGGVVTVRLKPDTTYFDTTYAQAQTYDLVIRNGRIVDGTGAAM